MKFLKNYKIYEAMFDTSSLEDILLELTDDGGEWTIVLTKGSNGNDWVVLNICFRMNTDITKTLLRVNDYLSTEGYQPIGNTPEIIRDIKSNDFEDSFYVNITIDDNDEAQNNIEVHYGKKSNEIR